MMMSTKEKMEGGERERENEWMRMNEWGDIFATLDFRVAREGLSVSEIWAKIWRRWESHVDN